MQQIAVDIGLVQHIESALCVDCAESRDIIAPLVERDERRHQRGSELTAAEDRALDREIDRATDGSWLSLWELDVIQRLRGWNRLRYGSIRVDRSVLELVREVLGNLTLALGDECEETLREIGVSRVRIAPVEDPEWLAPWRGEVLASMKRTGYCGDCLWCQVCYLHDRVAALLKPQ